MNQDDVGMFFTTTGEDIWELIIYCEYPTATLRNLKTGERVGGAIGSPNLQPFRRLVPEKAIKEE